MTYIYNQTKLIFDTKILESHVDQLKLGIKESKHVTLSFFVIKLDMSPISLLLELYPSVLVDIITEYNGELLECYNNGYNSTRQLQYYTIYTLPDNNIETKIRIHNATIKIYVNGINIPVDHILYLKYILDNNKFDSIINMHEDDLYNECKYICRNVFGHVSCSSFFICLSTIIFNEKFEDLLYMYTMYNIMINKQIVM